MLLLLPAVAFLLLFLGLRARGAGRRQAILFASIPWALFLAGLTELLSHLRALDRAGVALGWLVFLLASLAWFWWMRGSAPAEMKAQGAPGLSPGGIAALAATGVIAALVALVALASAPNTWDAMEYHLPRVTEWIVHRGVWFYPTPDRQQLDMSPFTEYTMLHFQLLWGSDRLAAFVSWLSWVGAALGVSLIARELGGGRRAQILAVVLAITLPSALLGASGANNDVMAGYWVALSVYLLLLWRRHRGWLPALAAGAAIGLAAFTKGTAYIYLPCLVAACWLASSWPARRLFLRWLPVIVATAALICLPLWVRNYRYSGSIFGLPSFDGMGPVSGRMFRNAAVTPADTLANVLRTAALDMGTPSGRVNALLTRGFSDAIRDVGVDPNDPGQMIASQLGGTPSFRVRYHPRTESLSGNPLHLLLFVLAGALALVFRRGTDRAALWLGLGVVAAFVLDCALLRWSPWNARYLIALFLVAAALTAAVLERSLPRWAVGGIAALALLLALPLALANDTRPLITRHGLAGSVLTTPRDETYFFDSHRQIAGDWIAAARAARATGCGRIGVDANRLRFEYPMMAMLRQGADPPAIRYMNVTNSSRRYANPEEPPVCLVVCMKCAHSPEKRTQYAAPEDRVQVFGGVVLFERKTAAR